MKRISFFLTAAALALLTLQSSAQSVPAPERIMQLVAAKLASVKHLGYKYRFEYSVPSQEKSTIQDATVFLDLKPDDGTAFRFQYTSADRDDRFNGTERFFLDKNSKKLYLVSKPTFDSSGNISLMNSPLSMKYALPRLIADATVRKKVSVVRENGRDQYLIEFYLSKAVINSDGSISETRSENVNKFQMKVDKATLLPVEVIQSNDKNDEIVRTNYSQVTERPSLPASPSWYYSTYAEEYTLQKKDKLTLIGPDKAAPAFRLAGYGGEAKYSLDAQRGKVVLLEFWIANCNFCISAVPKLNLIDQNYRAKGLEVVSVNMYDPVAKIDSFRKRYRPDYRILTGGDSIAESYGVESFPAFVLIDASGKIVYSSSGLEEKELEAAITANLQK